MTFFLKFPLELPESKQHCNAGTLTLHPVSSNSFMKLKVYYHCIYACIICIYITDLELCIYIVVLLLYSFPFTTVSI